MGNNPRGHKQPRNNDSGQFGKKKAAEQNPKKYTNEVVPNPGHGDTGRYDKKKPK